MADRQLRRAQRRLRFWLAGFFIALALPSALLVHRALDQLQWQAFHGEQTRARALAAEIDRRLQERLSVLDGRPFEDFRFAVRETDGTLRRSPLSDPGLAQALPGVMGYFQVDARGRFTSPSLPDDRTLGRGNEAGPADAAEEAASAMRVRDVLIGNRLVSGAGPSADKGVTEIIAAAPSPQALRREPRVAPEPEPEPKRDGNRCAARRRAGCSTRTTRRQRRAVVRGLGCG
jgi:two-component system phosphate regulon sensor histidine kinase PhoR